MKTLATSTELSKEVVNELITFGEAVHAGRFQKCLRNLLLDYLLTNQDQRTDFEDLLIDLDRLFTLLDAIDDHSKRV